MPTSVLVMVVQQLRVWVEEHGVRATRFSAGRADAMTARETKAAMFLNCILVGLGWKDGSLQGFRIGIGDWSEVVIE